MVATIFFCFLVSGASSSFAMGLESMVEGELIKLYIMILTLLIHFF